jgi:hypothetical protein
LEPQQACNTVGVVCKLTLQAKAGESSSNNMDEFSGEITMIVSDASRSRSAEMKVQVQVLPALSPVISLSSNVGKSKMNAGESLRLMAVLSVPSSLSSNMTWSLDSSTSSLVDLKKVALTPLLVQYSERLQATLLHLTSSSKTSYTLYLALPANVLLPGLRYGFQLQTTLASPGTTAVSSIAEVVNRSPQPGVFEVDKRRSGVELVDVFTFACSRWNDEDLPLSYAFAYQSSSGAEVVVRSRVEVAVASSLLPAGSSRNGFNVTAVVRIFDAMSADNLASVVVQVRERATDINTADVLSFLQSSTSGASSNNVDALLPLLPSIW